MQQTVSEAVDEAKAILAGNRVIEPAGALALAKLLKRENSFRWGRRVLERVAPLSLSEPDLRKRIHQEWALCAYKDPDRPALEALNAALDILGRGDDLAKTRDQETLGLAGAINKRLWQVTGQKLFLERSLYFYFRGYQSEPTANQGYTSINAAFVLDQLAYIEKQDWPAQAEQRRGIASEIRSVLARKLPEMEQSAASLASDWWYLVTVAEAFFGLGEYKLASAWLDRAKALEPSDWELRTAAFQLAALGQLQRDCRTPEQAREAERIIERFTGSDAARTSAFIGKVGLALSGGGFRASLFHIGLLARMAEVDLLRHVEVLSCVSGGSIIGAYYYLVLKETLECKDLEALTGEEIRQVYIEIVERLASEFLQAVQRNIRTKVFANPIPLLRAVADASYSCTTRLGELLEKELFARFRVKSSPGQGSPLQMRDLTIRPAGTSDFDPKRDNWRHYAKVPILVLNATTLNTGHNWQYTATYMGESPYAIDPNVDGTNRLRRVYYSQAPETHARTSLAQAVVASACVPGFFEPVRLNSLYQRKRPDKKIERFIVRQVDGGVHDNQGIASLIEQDCAVMLVSDASGQTATSLDPGGSVSGSLIRSNAVLMQRVRQEQFARLKGRQDTGLLKDLMFIHLKQDLDVEPVDWIGCDEPPERSAAQINLGAKTSYGVRKEVQNLLAALRTDLDSFSDTEAFALMTSGYRMAERFLKAVAVVPQPLAASRPWTFLNAEKVMTDSPVDSAAYRDFLFLLETGSWRFFRFWRQSRLLAIGAIVALMALIVGLLLLLLPVSFTLRLTLRFSRIGLLLAVGAIVIAAPLLSAAVRDHAGRIGMALLGLVLWIPSLIHLRFLDRQFLKRGKLDRVYLRTMVRNAHQPKRCANELDAADGRDSEQP
jgi:predicted acylesterase/phospholipase RssA